VILFFLAPEIIGRWEGGLIARSFRGEQVDSDQSDNHTPRNPSTWVGAQPRGVMISEVLFGYFSRSWIPLIGGIQRAELFEEKVTDAFALDQGASLLPGRVVLQSEIKKTNVTVH